MNTLGPAIINGTPSTGADLREETTVLIVDNKLDGVGGRLCSGTLLNNRWVITAAHCVYGSTPGQLTVIQGKSPIPWRSLPAGYQSYGVDNFYLHPDVDGLSPMDFDFKSIRSTDIALLELNGPMKVNYSSANFRRNIYKNRTGLLLGNVVRAYGYGRTTKTTAPLPPMLPLTFADMKVGGLSIFNRYQMAPTPTGQVVAPGDSGGPSFLGDELAGIHANGGDLSWDVSSEFFRSWALGMVNTELERYPLELPYTPTIFPPTDDLAGQVLATFSAPPTTTPASFYIFVRQKGDAGFAYGRATLVKTIDIDGQQRFVYYISVDRYVLDRSKCLVFWGRSFCELNVSIFMPSGRTLGMVGTVGLR